MAYKGKWHLTHPSGGAGAMLGGWTRHDAERIERDYGFGEWEAPTRARTRRPNFGGGNAGEGEGWDEVYTRQVERFLARADLPEPFCLVVSLVNPHDVLGYPASYLAGGYEPGEFRDLGVDLPPTIDEDLSTKPAVQSLMRMGMAAYLGPLSDRQAQLDYVNFYAHLHRVVDAKIGRLLTALGSADDPGSLRSRTVIVRTADHGEMGLAHGGLRQKAFNVYEETINVPLVVSNPVLFGRARERTRSRRSSTCCRPCWRSVAPRRREALAGHDLTPVIAAAAEPEREAVGRAAVDLGAVARPPGARALGAGRDPLHLRRPPGGDRMQDAPGQPNRVRAIRTRDAEVRALLRPERPGAERVRALRPRARPARGAQPGRRPRRRAARRTGPWRCGPSSPSASTRRWPRRGRRPDQDFIKVT